MQSLRKRMRIILFVALAAFLLLIFFQWGLDVMGIRTPQKTDIAKIDGQSISYTEYSRFVQFKEQENKEITRDEIFATLIDEIMWNNLIRRERIRVTDEEIWAIIKNNPPREIYESEDMKDEKGVFDMNKYYEFLSSPQSRQWLLQYEYSIREQLPREKIRSLLSTMGWISPYEDSLVVAMQLTRYDISSIAIPLHRLQGLAQVSEEQIHEYYVQNPQEFIRPESKILKYVFFEKKPTHDDTLEAKESMEDFLLRITEEGEDFLEVAREVSDIIKIEYPFKDEMELPPHLIDVYKKLRDGGVSDMIETTQGFEVIKRIHKGLIYRVTTNIQISPTTLGEIHDRIVSFHETAQEHSFDSAAVDFNLPIHKTFPLNKNNLSFPIRNVEALKNFLSHAKHGTIGGPFSSLGGYYLFTLDSLIPEYTPTLEEAAPRIKMKFERDNVKNELTLHLERISNQLKSGTSLRAIASVDTLTTFSNDIKNATLIDIRNSYGDEFTGVVAALEPNQTSAPLITDWAGYIIRCDKKYALPYDSTMVTFLQMKRQLRLQYLTQDLFTPKSIEDDRDEFFE